MRANLPRILLIVALLAVAGGGAYMLWQSQSPAAAAAQSLAASGTIEATDYTIAAESSGRVVTVAAAEGQTVAAGAVLVQLDDSLLKAQRAQAAGALQQAQAGLAIAQARLAQAQQGNARASDVAAAQAQLDLAQANYARLTQKPQPWQLDAARAAVASAQAGYVAAKQSAGAVDPQLDAALAAMEKAAANLTVAQQNYDRVAWLPYVSATELSQALQMATIDYQQAQANYTSLAATSGPQAQSRLSQAAAQLAQAKAALDQLQQPYTDADLAAAQANLDLAKANLARLTAAGTPNDVAIAQAAVDQAQGAVTSAQATLDALDIQLAKLTITAPAGGTVTARSIEPGEMAMPGATLLTLADLAHLELTVYVPEDRFGEIKLGDTAAVVVDSFPGETFHGTVVHIADTAEFTPRNVETVDGRKTTVFAVKLNLDNPDGRLKPGMPADVTFGQ